MLLSALPVGSHFALGAEQSAVGTVIRQGEGSVTVQFVRKDEDKPQRSAWSPATVVTRLAQLPERVEAETPASEAQPAAPSVGKRYDVFGHPVTAILRWMGSQGWTFEQARKALDKLACSCADATLRIQLAKGKRGQPGAPVTPDQANQLAEAAGMTIQPTTPLTKKSRKKSQKS